MHVEGAATSHIFSLPVSSLYSIGNKHRLVCLVYTHFICIFEEEYSIEFLQNYSDFLKSLSD